MSKTKLTPAQIRVLRRMADGDEVWTLFGPNQSSFWKNSRSWRSPGLKTARALSDRGLVEEYENDFNGAKYRITPAGRAALAEAEESQ